MAQNTLIQTFYQIYTYLLLIQNNLGQLNLKSGKNHRLMKRPIHNPQPHFIH